MNSKILRGALAATLLLIGAATAHAELESVEIGGGIKLRGNYYSSGYGLDFTGEGPPKGLRWRQLFLSGRPIGNNGNINSFFSWDKDDAGIAFINQRTRLNIRAKFTNEVSTFVELDNYSYFGQEDAFRSNFFSGVDVQANAGDVALYQAYIEADNMWGVPLRLRIGRQELDELPYWLVSAKDSGVKFTGLSFDAVRATYFPDFLDQRLTFDAFASKLAETLSSKDDTDFYGIIGSLALNRDDVDDIAGETSRLLSAYYFYLRDGADYEDTSGIVSNWLEDKLDLDNYDALALHTAGIELSGTDIVGAGLLGYRASVAYQFGNAGAHGGDFKPDNFVNRYFGNYSVFGRSRYGDDDAHYGNIGASTYLNYKLTELKLKPSFEFNAAYFGGEDNRDISGRDWVASIFNPASEAKSSLGFNRLFSDDQYSQFLDLDNSMSNVMIFGGRVGLAPSDAVEVGLSATKFRTIDTFDAPLAVKVAGRNVVPLFPLSFLDKKNSADLGWELGLDFSYQYSADLRFSARWSHLFVGEGLADGNFSDGNGVFFNGGTGDDDVDYVYAQTEITF